MDLYHSGAQLLATDQYGMTCLHHAARFGHKDIVKYLIANGKSSKFLNILKYEPRLEKTCLRGIPPGLTQTSLYRLEARNFGFRN